MVYLQMYLGHQLNFPIFVIIKREKVFIKKKKKKIERKSKRLNPMIMKELNFKKIERLFSCEN